MKSLDLSALSKALTKNKFVLLALCLGLLLLLLPRRSESASSVPATQIKSAASAGDPLGASGIPLAEECNRIAALLSDIRGVGRARVLLSSGGCVVVCQGADSPGVRLNVTNAVAAYTGLGSDRIRIFKMNISGGNEA